MAWICLVLDALRISSDNAVRDTNFLMVPLVKTKHGADFDDAILHERLYDVIGNIRGALEHEIVSVNNNGDVIHFTLETAW